MLTLQEFYESRNAGSEPIEDEINDSEIFYKAVGGHDKKRRVYGLGSFGRALFLGNCSGEKCAPSTTNSQQHLKSQVQNLEATVEQQQMELSNMRSMVNDLKNMMEK